MAKRIESRTIQSLESRAASPGIAVIGPGNWGSSLVHALCKAGIPPREVIFSRSERALPGLSSKIPRATLERAHLDSEILWLCVPDAAIEPVTRRLVRQAHRQRAQHLLPLRNQIVVHSSGALSVSVLDSAAKAGATVASVHPVMTFPARVPVALSGVPFGVEAGIAARRKLYAIVRKLGGEPFHIRSSDKALYHVIGMFASPLLVSLIAAAQRAAHLAGLSPLEARRVIEPIARASLQNVLTKDKASSFSGPIARGDSATIHLHLQALLPHPILADVYRSLAIEAVDALPARNRKQILSLLRADVSPTTAIENGRGKTRQSLGPTHEKLRRAR